MGRSPAPLRPRVLVDRLVDLAPRLSLADRQAKAFVLDQLETAVIGAPDVLRRYHEALCYLQAYPDDAALLVRVDRALAGWGTRIGRISRHARAHLADSGMAGTTLRYPFGLAMGRWLAARVPRQVRIVWGALEEGERLEETLSLLVTRIEGEAFTEGGPGWRRWLRSAAGGRRLTELQLLIEIFERAPVNGPTRDWLFESLGLTVEWRLSPTGPSRTLARVGRPPALTAQTTGRPHAAARGRRRGSRRQLAQTVRRPLPLKPAPLALAATLIEAARIAMATRARELFAFSYPNPRDVLVADPEQGLRIALVGPRARATTAAGSLLRLPRSQERCAGELRRRMVSLRSPGDGIQRLRVLPPRGVSPSGGPSPSRLSPGLCHAGGDRGSVPDRVPERRGSSLGRPVLLSATGFSPDRSGCPPTPGRRGGQGRP